MKIHNESITIGTHRIISHISTTEHAGEYTYMNDGKLVEFVTWEGDDEQADALSEVRSWLHGIALGLVESGYSFELGELVAGADFGHHTPDLAAWQASIDRDYEIDGADLREEMMLEELEG